MATINELVESYALKIKSAVRKSELSWPLSESSIKRAFLIEDPLIKAFKDIKEELDQLTYNGKLFSKEEKYEILRKVGEYLGLSRAERLPGAIKEASNDNAIALVDFINQMINEVKE